MHQLGRSALPQPSVPRPPLSVWCFALCLPTMAWLPWFADMQALELLTIEYLSLGTGIEG